jgi:tRNA pseudouridine55 synthase
MEASGRIIRRKLDGVLLLDKPAGLSSTQAMAAAKRILRAEKAGHTGTLDPFATGLLPVCFGEATKFSRFMLDAAKSYRATLKLGEISSTGDTEGSISTSGHVDVDERRAHEVLAQFVGPQTQIPPMHSALKQDGVPLYKLARQGIDVQREARNITVFGIRLESLNGDVMVIDVDVSKGTYVRVLAEDIGRALGCGAHLKALRRTGTGGFSVEAAHGLDALRALSEADAEKLLLPSESLVASLPIIRLPTLDAAIFCNGGWVDLPIPDAAGSEIAAWNEVGKILGVGQVAEQGESRRLIPSRLMSTHSPSGAQNR